MLVEPHGLLPSLLPLFLLPLSFSVWRTAIIYVLCRSISQTLLPVAEVYDYTSAPRRRGILDMSRGTKSKAVFREKASPPQDESGSGDMKIADHFWMLSERMGSRFDEQETRFQEMDSRFEALQEDIKHAK